jgi:hypothetical protein
VAYSKNSKKLGILIFAKALYDIEIKIRSKGRRDKGTTYR